MDNAWWHWENRALFFFMPWFFFKGGMFFHPMVDRRECVRRTVRRLLAPMMAWSLISIPIGVATVLVSDRAGMWQWYAGPLLKHPLLLGTVGYNGPLWFLTALFLVRVAANYVAVVWKRLSAIAILCVALAVACQYSPLRWPLFEHTLTGLFFYIVGYKLRRVQYRRDVSVVSVIVLALISAFAFTAVDMNYNSLNVGKHYILFFPFSLAAIITANTLEGFLPPPYASCAATLFASRCVAWDWYAFYGLFRHALAGDTHSQSIGG